MFYATATSGERIGAAPGASASCPSCAADVQPKCGAIVSWHWAHAARNDCDPWAEPDSSWHRAWQEAVPPERREVVRGSHRADIVSADGWVVELQHSSIPPAEIAEREAFYGPRMMWVFDASEPWQEERLDLRKMEHLPGNRRYVTFRWKHPRTSIGHCRRRVLLDLGDDWLLSLRRIYLGGRCGGWGYAFPSEHFREWLAGAT
jgi:hypothetical protein